MTGKMQEYARSLCGVALKLGNLYRLLVYAVEAS